MFRKYISSIAVLPLAVLAAQAQSIDPTVEVSRAYEGRMIEVHKPMTEMEIPDSVTHFDLDFDYSVFDNPYKGTYEFNPYMQNMKPQHGEWPGRRLFLRAGAGYPLHPVFDLVWSPDLKGRFRMDAYAMHRSYIGRYRGILPVKDEGTGDIYLDSPLSSGSGASRTGWNGYDMLTKAGFEGRLGWSGGVLTFNAGYFGLATRDSVLTRGYNALDLGLRVRSDASRDRYFLYDAALAYRYGADNMTFPEYAGSLAGHEFTLASSFGPVFSREQRLVLGVDADIVSYSSVFGTSAGRFAVSPRYSLEKGRWSLDLGLQLSVLFSGGRSGSLPAQDAGRGQYVYPDISAGFEIIRDCMQIYVKAGGGDKVGKYSDMISYGHFIHPFYTYGISMPLLDNSVERLSVAAGLRGNIASRFRYDLSAGYRIFARAPLFVSVSDSPYMLGAYSASLAYTGYNMFYASFDYGWESKDFSLDGNFTYRSSDVDIASPVQMQDGRYMAFFAPARFSGDIRALYNWRKRIFAGADCDFSMARESALFDIRGYADLGVYLEFRAARLFSFWLRGGNLLGMTVQRMPMYAESGINFTAGICLNL